MNRQDIIQMAKEAGLDLDGENIFSLKSDPQVDVHIADLEAFAALVAAHALVEPCCGNYDQCQKICMPRAANAEREACAKVCDDHCGWTPRMIGLTIRARG